MKKASLTKKVAATKQGAAKKTANSKKSKRPPGAKETANHPNSHDSHVSSTLSERPVGATWLSEREQAEYLTLLGRGASPAAACRQLLLEVDQLALTLEQIPLFAARVNRIHQLLSQNVAAALYRAAMEGSVSAQTFFLRNLPPPEWQPDRLEQGGTDNDFEEWNELTDEELQHRWDACVAQYQTQRVGQQTEVAQSDAAPSPPPAPESVS